MQQDNTPHVLKCDLGDEVTRAKLEWEALLLDLLRHPHVVNLYRVLQLGWPSADSIALDMEYCLYGDLLHARLGTTEVRACFEQVRAALLYCHSQGAHAITKSSIALTCRLRN